MSLSPGARLGPYEVIASAGAGGMGEVWKARDTRLERSVAIKVLPAEFASNAQLRLRFEREAKSISQLNHPHICTLYDVGNENGIEYLVLEYIEGETLADRLRRGPLPLDQVLRYGIEVADALDRAHKAGIVHRDLKPGNIMLTKSGAKLLDFGLAKSGPVASGNSTVTPEDATIAAMAGGRRSAVGGPLTAEGTILGTWQYMSPEQVAGEEADARSDVFSFGAVLYEMLTGRRAFEGKTKTSVIAAIVAGEPRPAAELQPLTPAALEHVIVTCLAKEPDARWQSTADIAGELRWIGESVTHEAAVSRRPWRASIPAIALGLVATAAIAATIWLARRIELVERPIEAELTMPASSPLTPSTAGPIALSPDGTRVALLVGGGGVAGSDSLAIRNLSTGQLRLLSGTEGALFPFWSPDGKRLGFFATGKLKTISVDGGPIDILCDAREARGGSWSPKGLIVFAPAAHGPLFTVPEGGGTPVPVTKVSDPARMTNRNPVFLPDGKSFLFTSRDLQGVPINGGTGGDVCLGAVDERPAKVIVQNASNAAVAGDHIFFVRNRNLMAQKFDGRSRATGTPIDLADGIEYRNGFDLGNFSVAANVIAYVPAVSRSAQIGVFDTSGRLLDVKGDPGDYTLLDVSPDGKRVAVALTDGAGATDVWILHLDRGVLSRVTMNNSGYTAAFSPDGQRIAIATPSSASIEALDGGSAEKLFDHAGLFGLSGWSADGKVLLDAFGVKYYDLQQRKFVRVAPTIEANGTGGTLSPDGEWLAYSTRETGSSEVYVTEFPTGRGKWQVSVNGGSWPRWSADGKQLFFIRGGSLYTTDVSAQDGLHFGVPKALPVTVAIPDATALASNYRITRDGRIVTLANVMQSAPTAVHLVLNWSKLLPQ